jgi:DNA-binding response OmpR family regulator
MENTTARKKAVLCVDDDQDTCEMLTILLGQAGYDVTHAMNVTEGLALAERGGFDLILLDWYLPDGTGIELCMNIRKFDKFTPIIFYTGEAQPTELHRALGVGANAYLVKPVDTDELLKVMESHIGPGNSAS